MANGTEIEVEWAGDIVQLPADFSPYVGDGKPFATSAKSVDIVLRGGERLSGPAHLFDWGRGSKPFSSDIVAYKVTGGVSFTAEPGLEGERTADDIVSGDANTLAAELLADLGYTFAANCWVAPAPNPLTKPTPQQISDYLDMVDRLQRATTVPPTAPALLAAARGHLLDRAATYDKPEGERSMAATVAAFNAQTGRDLAESEGWLLMVNLKIVRDRQRPAAHRDSCEDLVAYGALYGESRLNNSERK